MKKFKLLLAAFVATLFAFVGGNAFAYTITINNVSKGHTYEAYQIFGGDLYKGDGATTPTLSNIRWGDGVTAFTYDGESDAAKIAEKLSTFLSQKVAHSHGKQKNLHLSMQILWWTIQDSKAKIQV